MRYSPPDGCSLGSAVQPVTIALRHLALGVDPTAAYWDFDLLDGHGGWRAEGCNITGSVGNTTTIYCTHHKNFAVLMVSDPPPPPHSPSSTCSLLLFTFYPPLPPKKCSSLVCHNPIPALPAWLFAFECFRCPCLRLESRVSSETSSLLGGAGSVF